MLARADSLAKADSLFRLDSLNQLSYSSLKQPAFSNARDSIVEVFTDGKRMIHYYGEVTVKYQDMTLTAERMDYDMNTGVVYARGVLDTLTGEWKGLPVMVQGKQSYKMHEIRYNFNSQKVSIKQALTQEDEGLLHGQHIKIMPDKSMNVEHGKYTVCDLEHPHYWMELSVAKVVTKPTRKTVFGPAHLVVADVHIPFIGIPFGFIPKKPERATGLLMPTFGEENARGFFMRDAGMYFVFGDYLDLSVTGDYYTLGSWGVDVNSRYKVNYKFNGNLSFNYSHDQTGEKGAPDFFSSSNFGIKWSHSQDSKARPGTTFSASVNFSSPSNSRYNSHSVNEALQNQVSSSISYSKNWNGKVNLSMNLLHNQNSRDSSYAFTLPNITLSVSTFYPFRARFDLKKISGTHAIWNALGEIHGYSAMDGEAEPYNSLSYLMRGNTMANLVLGIELGISDISSFGNKLASKTVFKPYKAKTGYEKLNEVLEDMRKRYVYPYARVKEDTLAMIMGETSARCGKPYATVAKKMHCYKGRHDLTVTTLCSFMIRRKYTFDQSTNMLQLGSENMNNLIIETLAELNRLTGYSYEYIVKKMLCIRDSGYVLLVTVFKHLHNAYGWSFAELCEKYHIARDAMYIRSLCNF